MQTSSYQPFLIGEGKSKTGYFTYTDSWVKPDDAFDTLQNAYIYRGSIYQRSGLSLFPSAFGAGAPVYTDNFELGIGDGTNRTFSQTLPNFPVIANANLLITVTTMIGATVVTGMNTGSFGATGTIVGTSISMGTLVYATGVLTLVYATAPTNGQPVIIEYSYVPSQNTTPTNNPIMGIKQFLNETNDTYVLVVLDTRRMSWWNPVTKSFVPQNTFEQFLYQFPNPNDNSIWSSTRTNPVATQWTDIAPYSVTITDNIPGTPDSMVDDGSGNFINTGGTRFNAPASTIDYATGVVNVFYKTAPPAGTLVQIQGSLTGDYFSGSNSNFFNSVNWAPAETDNQLYLTNNVDFITTFDGTFLSRPAFGLMGAGTPASNPPVQVTRLAPSTVLLPYINAFLRCLDIKVYKDRLLIFRPTLTTDFEPEGQGVFYSAINQPLNFVDDIAGNGDNVQISTGDWIMSTQLLRDGIVLFMNNSTWFFRFTANPFDPFRADQLNSSKSTNAPYASAIYDITATSMGAKGLIECDGVGVERYDINVIDLFEEINQTWFQQCFAQRYDSLNHTWMLYPSVSSGLHTSDSALIYNFLEKTWAIFTFNLGQQVQNANTANTLSCLGLSFTTEDLTWADFAPGSGTDVAGLKWSQFPHPWNHNLIQNLAPVLLAGDQNGFVYICNDGPTDNPGPAGTGVNGIQTIIQSKRLNPYIPQGQKCRFGYLDVYYEVNNAVSITMKFNSNNSGNGIQTFQFNLDGSAGEAWAWKRFYINTVAEFIQIEITSEVQGFDPDTPVYNTNGVFKILGMVLWASPAGRLVPGSFI